MARLADICSSSDDELPDLKTILSRSSTRVKGGLGKGDNPLVSNGAHETRPISEDEPRRVRRLGQNGKTKPNPLLQKWDSALHDDSNSPMRDGKNRQSPVKQVSRNVTHAFSSGDEGEDEDEDEDEDDEPRSYVRKPFQRRKQIIHDSEESEESAEDKGSDKEIDTLLTRIRRLRKSRTDAATVPQTTTAAAATKSQSSKANDKSKSWVAVSTKAVDSHSDNGDGLTTSEGDDPSLYQTADDSELSKDDEDSNVESDWMLDSPAQPVKKSTGRQHTIPAKDMTSCSKDARPFELRTLANGLPVLQSKKSRPCREMRDDADTTRSKKQLLHNHRNPKLTASSTTATDLANSLAKLRLQLDGLSDGASQPGSFTTPPSTPPKGSNPRGLVSPSKRIQIPKTPHGPGMDAFWNQDVVDDWNEQHSPQKLALPSALSSPVKKSLKKMSKMETKKVFDAKKHTIAEHFLAELDEKITQGKISKLAESTGGVKLIWTKSLNTTAGRATWRRETVRTRRPDGTEVSVTYKHHASIELAQKVIDDEYRLINVLAHEFCHLANFMVSGISNNPHGREFKIWAAQCTKTFADRGIEVTTKHSYDIDFKYVWECEACGDEFKRHSKSIDLQKHRCGSCKGTLKQTKPVPRGQGSRGPSRWQMFMKEQMAVVKKENPGCSQKVVMTLIAEKWAKQEGKAPKKSSTGVGGAVDKLIDLTLEE